MQCGLCERWFRSLPPHLRHAHDLTAEEYRRLFGLRAQRPFVSEDVSSGQRERLRRRLKAREPALLLDMAQGRELARAGVLPRARVAVQRTLPLEGERLASAHGPGRRIGRGPVCREHAPRATLEPVSWVPVILKALSAPATPPGRGSLISDALGVAPSTVVGDIERLGLARRPVDDQLARCRAALAKQRHDRGVALELRAQALGFANLCESSTR